MESVPRVLQPVPGKPRAPANGCSSPVRGRLSHAVGSEHRFSILCVVFKLAPLSPVEFLFV